MADIILGKDGFIKAERVLSIGRAKSAPMRRLLATLPPDKVIYLTGGRRRRSVVLLDTGHAVVTALDVEEVRAQLLRKAPRHTEVD